MLGNRLEVGQRTLDSGSRHELLTNFLKSRRQGLSPKTLKFYEGYLQRAFPVVGLGVTVQGLAYFLESLQCSDSGKHAYFRALRAFYKWLYSRRSGYNLNPQDNPIEFVDAPKVGMRILPSLTIEEVETLINLVHDIRDKLVISLFADSGMRLSELANIQPSDIDWQNDTITIIGKGNKQRRAPFTKRTARMLQIYLSNNGHTNGNIWGINPYGIQQMLERLEKEAGIKCNPHAFRRGFAYNLRRKGLSTLDIMHLGGWSDLSMVLRYTRSITFEDCLEHYRKVESLT